MKFIAAITIALPIFLLSSCSPPENESITIHVASSMTDAIQEVADLFSAETGIPVQLNVSSTGILARQIASGAPADVFVSANTEWMDYVTNEVGLVHQSRIRIATNRLVAVVNVNATEMPKHVLELQEFADSGIAVGDPSHVPAGVYAREALQRAGVWDAIKDHIIPALDVRAALAYVERGEVGCGIVYSSDSLLSKDVRIAFEFQTSLHSPILYEAAIPSGANIAAARTFLDFLNSSIGRDALKKYGFTPTPGRQ